MKSVHLEGTDFSHFLSWSLGFPHSSVVKNLPANTEDVGSVPGWGIPWTEEHSEL